MQAQKKKEPPRGSDGKRLYRMDFIPDKDLFKAVSFSRKMIREGMSPGLAHKKAADYYKVSKAEVAKFVGQFAGSMSHKNK